MPPSDSSLTPLSDSSHSLFTERDDEENLCPANAVWVRRFMNSDELPIKYPSKARYVHGLKVAIQKSFPSLQQLDFGDFKISLMLNKNDCKNIDLPEVNYQALKAKSIYLRSCQNIVTASSSSSNTTTTTTTTTTTSSSRSSSSADTDGRGGGDTDAGCGDEGPDDDAGQKTETGGDSGDLAEAEGCTHIMSTHGNTSSIPLNLLITCKGVHLFLSPRQLLSDLRLFAHAMVIVHVRDKRTGRFIVETLNDEDESDTEHEEPSRRKPNALRNSSFLLSGSGSESDHDEYAGYTNQDHGDAEKTSLLRTAVCRSPFSRHRDRGSPQRSGWRHPSSWSAALSGPQPLQPFLHLQPRQHPPHHQLQSSSGMSHDQLLAAVSAGNAHARELAFDLATDADTKESYHPGTGTYTGSHAAERRPRRSCSEWCAKYFCAGQIKSEDANASSRAAAAVDPSWSWFYTEFVHHRPAYVTTFLPLVLVWVCWLVVMGVYDQWGNFAEAGGFPGWYMALTMIFGSFVAGATSEGGGSIAYPVMTLILSVSSQDARDFSLMIQSIGMTSASFTVLYNQIQCEMLAVVWSTLGGALGIVIGLQFIAPALPSDYTKMIFVSIWLAFALNLGILNMQRKRVTRLIIADRERVLLRTKVVLTAVGFVGGVLSALSGSGLDICTFSVLTLYYRLNEKTATPTSVVLMGINTVFGFFFRSVIMGGITQQTWKFWSCAVPVVVLGAPVGAYVSSFLHRQVLASFVYITDVAQFVMACAITSLDATLGLVTAACVFGSFGMFRWLAHLGSVKLDMDVDLGRPTLPPIAMHPISTCSLGRGHSVYSSARTKTREGGTIDKEEEGGDTGHGARINLGGYVDTEEKSAGKTNNMCSDAEQNGRGNNTHTHDPSTADGAKRSRYRGSVPREEKTQSSENADPKLVNVSILSNVFPTVSPDRMQYLVYDRDMGRDRDSAGDAAVNAAASASPGEADFADKTQNRKWRVLNIKTI